jgi:hypothetical protein
MWWGTFAGVAVSVWLSYSFVLPSDILNLQLSAITIGDILRMFGALIITVVISYIGHLVDIGIGNAE